MKLSRLFFVTNFSIILYVNLIIPFNWGERESERERDLKIEKTTRKKEEKKKENENGN